MQTRRVLNIAVTTVGIYFTYLSILTLLLKFGSFFTSGMSTYNMDKVAIIMNIALLLFGLTLITRPMIITKSVKCREEETNNNFDLSSIEQIIIKIMSILLIVYNFQVSLMQAASINDYLAMENYENHILWMKMNLIVRVILMIIGVIIFLKSYSVSKFIFKEK